MPSEAELAGRVGLALVLGGLVGLERELTDQPAGLRTHVSIALGAALFAMVSVYGFDAFGEQPRNDSSYQVDVTRVASNIVTGVGFLGGGAIVKYGASVRGLTTAASIWVTAAIGLAVGLGTYFIAAVTTAALLLSLQGLRRPRRWLRKRLIQAKETVTIRMRSPADVGTVVAALHDLAGVEVRSVSMHRTDEEIVVEADLRAASPEQLQVRLAELAQRPEVEEVDQAE